MRIVEASTYHAIHKPKIKHRFNWFYLIFFQFNEIYVGESYRQRTPHCAAISLFVKLRLKNVSALCHSLQQQYLKNQFATYRR